MIHFHKDRFVVDHKCKGPNATMETLKEISRFWKRRIESMMEDEKDEGTHVLDVFLTSIEEAQVLSYRIVVEHHCEWPKVDVLRIVDKMHLWSRCYYGTSEWEMELDMRDHVDVFLSSFNN